jgi:hypothetical protein
MPVLITEPVQSCGAGDVVGSESQVFVAATIGREIVDPGGYRDKEFYRFSSSSWYQGPTYGKAVMSMLDKSIVATMLSKESGPRRSQKLHSPVIDGLYLGRVDKGAGSAPFCLAHVSHSHPWAG